MLTADKQAGFTLVELMIGIALIGLLLAMGIPSFRDWIQNSQIRNGTESIKNGLLLARAEAVRRNTNVRFVLTQGFDWKVQCVTPVSGVMGNCPGVGMVPDYIQAYASSEGARNADISADATIVFNGLGRLTPTPAGNLTIDITKKSDSAACIENGGELRCFRLVISAAGQVKMCDPSVAWSVTAPHGC